MITRKPGEGRGVAAETKAIWAKKEFVLDSPFFATELLYLDIREATDEEKATMTTKSMGTDGTVLIWCQEFVDKLDYNEILGVFAHEIMHVVAMHQLRRGQRDPIIWNIACDLAINPIVRQAGFTLPDGVLFKQEFEDMDAETIYNHLIRQSEKSMKQMIDSFMKGGQKGTGTCGWVMDKKNDDGSEMSQSQKAQAEREQKVINEGAALVQAKSQGSMPAFLERLLGKLREAKVNWKEALAQFVEVNSKSDYNWLKPNRRYTKDKLYLPQAYKPEIGHVVNLVDASGSVSREELIDEVSELQGILYAYEGVTLSVIFFDTIASKSQEITDDTELEKLKIGHGGGTDFRPPFKQVETESIDPVCIICITDGHCDSFPKEHPDVPVLWILAGSYNTHFKPPFGDVIVVENMGQRQR